MSTTQSAAAIVSSSCSTTISVFPRSRSRVSVSMSRWLSRWCRPIDGSSSTYSTPVRPDPICVASRIRCASPPASVAAGRSSDRYPSPTSARKPSRVWISLNGRSAISSSREVRRSSRSQEAASVTGRAATSAIDRPPTVTARISGASRAPPHAGHGTARMNASCASRAASVSASA